MYSEIIVVDTVCNPTYEDLIVENKKLRDMKRDNSIVKRVFYSDSKNYSCNDDNKVKFGKIRRLIKRK